MVREGSGGRALALEIRRSKSYDRTKSEAFICIDPSFLHTIESGRRSTEEPLVY